MLYTVLTILIVIASLLMVGIVLVQKSKGGGLAENFAKGNDFAGVKQTSDLVENVTWGLMAFIAVLCIFCSSISRRQVVDNSGDAPEVKNVPSVIKNNPAPAPAPAAPVETPAAAPAAPAN